MHEYKFIPYDKKLVSTARELRKAQTEPEKQFWKILKAKPFSEFKFVRQKPIDNFILDFYCSKLRLGIEIDGEIHKFQKTRDLERDSIPWHKFGLRVLRYTNNQVAGNLEGVIKDLSDNLRLPPDKGDRGG